MLMINSVVYSALIKQSWNTNRLTESKLVGVDGLMPQILCMLYLSEAQGFNVYDNVQT